MSEWQNFELKELTTKIGSGATPRGGQEAYKAEGTSLIRSQNILDFSFSYSGLAFIDDEQAHGLKNVIVEKDDVLINITGDSVARLAKVPIEVLPARVNQHVAILRADKAKLDSNYLLYYLLNPLFKRHLLRIASDGATRNALTKVDLEDLIIVAPEDVNEQKEIANLLSVYDQKITLLRLQNQTLEELAQTLFKRWFVEFEFPNENGEPYKSSGGKMVESELGEIPEGWRVGALGSLADVNPKESIRKDSDAPYIEMKNLSNLDMGVANTQVRPFASGSKFKNEDILLARITPCLENGKTGYVDVLKDNEVGWGSTEFIVLRSKVASSEFIYCLCRNDEFRDHAIKNMTGSSGRMRVPNDIVENYTIPIGESDVYDQFERIVNPLFVKTTNNRAEIQTLTQLRDTLLPKLMSGELKVKSEQISYASQ